MNKDYYGIENGHEWIDLGLPSGTLWATCNLGAENPHDVGFYYAWGEISPKERYEENNCKTLNRYFDNKILAPKDDVAHTCWGEVWSAPSYDEFQELRTHCAWEAIVENNVFGYKVTGPNGMSIFLPGAGCRYSIANLNAHEAMYWTSTSESNDACNAYCLHATPYEHLMRTYERVYGLSIRPVCRSNNSKSEIKHPTIQETVYLSQQINGIEDNHEWVDLCLPSGIKWATCNIGANSCEESGEFFAWGENKSKKEFQKTDYIGDYAHDAAQHNWGYKWYLPNKDNFKELQECCTWEWTTINGVAGYKVTGINGNSIFLPVTGYCYDTQCDDYDYGYYWSISPGGNFDFDAHFLYFNRSGHYMSLGNRSYGRCIRPIKK